MADLERVCEAAKTWVPYEACLAKAPTICPDAKSEAEATACVIRNQSRFVAPTNPGGEGTEPTPSALGEALGKAIGIGAYPEQTDVSKLTAEEQTTLKNFLRNVTDANFQASDETTRKSIRSILTNSTNIPSGDLDSLFRRARTAANVNGPATRLPPASPALPPVVAAAASGIMGDKWRGIFTFDLIMPLDGTRVTSPKADPIISEERYFGLWGSNMPLAPYGYGGLFRFAFLFPTDTAKDFWVGPGITYGFGFRQEVVFSEQVDNLLKEDLKANATLKWMEHYLGLDCQAEYFLIHGILALYGIVTPLGIFMNSNREGVVDDGNYVRDVKSALDVTRYYFGVEAGVRVYVEIAKGFSAVASLGIAYITINQRDGNELIYEDGKQIDLQDDLPYWKAGVGVSF